MDHSGMNHMMTTTAGMDHSTMNHTGMDHSTMNHTGMDHSGMDHSGMDHSGMDHSGMDHSGMNHGNMESGHSMMGGMNMYFTTNWQMQYVLFEQCQLMEDWHLAVACVILAILAALYEGLKVFREHMLITYQVAERQQHSDGTTEGALYMSESSPSSSKVEITSSHQSHSVRSRMCSWLHITQTVLHMLQISLSYMLMLVVMTYNVYLCLSVVLGAGIGYFAFGWKRAVINDRNEHCH